MSRVLEGARQFWSDKAGASTVEFALLAPLLITALLTAFDLGGALQQKMKMAHIMRVGAETAAAQPPSRATSDATTQILAHMRLAAEGSSRASLPRSAVQHSLTMQVEHACACPQARTTLLTCHPVCPGGATHFIFFRLRITQTYVGHLIPTLPLNAEMLIQVR
jgi:Flp pilus assembly protein TadG